MELEKFKQKLDELNKGFKIEIICEDEKDHKVELDGKEISGSAFAIVLIKECPKCNSPNIELLSDKTIICKEKNCGCVTPRGS
jgi:hypothetical protein